MIYTSIHTYSVQWTCQLSSSSFPVKSKGANWARNFSTSFVSCSLGNEQALQSTRAGVLRIRGDASTSLKTERERDTSNTWSMSKFFLITQPSGPTYRPKLREKSPLIRATRLGPSSNSTRKYACVDATTCKWQKKHVLHNHALFLSLKRFRSFCTKNKLLSYYKKL